MAEIVPKITLSVGLKAEEDRENNESDGWKIYGFFVAVIDVCSNGMI